MPDSSDRHNFDAVIYAAEINDRHGVGVLLQRIFPDTSRILSVRAENWYGGEHTFGQVALHINHRGLTRSQGLAKVADALANYQIERILCIPYQIDEVLTALALQELFGSPICTYLMDDQNILVKSIPDNLMSELLSKSRLCLAISTEMCDVYKAKYAVDFHFTPPVLPFALANLHPNSRSSIAEIPSNFLQKGVMIGNVWCPTWLKSLQAIIKESGITIDWYGNTGAEWNIGDRHQLLEDGIIEKGFLPTEAEVVLALKQYQYAIVPSGSLDLSDGNPATAWLSLPSRIPFILATAHIPIIVLGHSDTGAARFVETMGVGIAATYESKSLLSAIERITQDRQHFYQQAKNLAPLLIDRRTDLWIWDSLAIAQPIDSRFQKILETSTSKLSLKSGSNYLTALTQALDTIGSQRSEIISLKNALTLAEQTHRLEKEKLAEETRVLNDNHIRDKLKSVLWRVKNVLKQYLKKLLKKLFYSIPKLPS